MLAAARREKVEDRVAIAEAAGLKATVMDIESYAARAALERAARAAAERGAGQIVALFQIGAQATHISVLLNGETVYEREQPFGGNQLTQDIVRAYGLSFEEAEARKKTRRPAGELPRRPAAAVPGKRRAGSHARDPVLLHLDAVHPDRPDLPGRRLRLLPGLLDIVASRTRIASAVVVAVQGHAAGPERARTAAAPRGAGLPGRLRPGAAEVRLMIRINLLPAPGSETQAEAGRLRRADGAGRRWSASRWCCWSAATTPAASPPRTSATGCSRRANAELDKKIGKIATLKHEIEALKARQQAVEDLQGDRNQPVYLLDELVKQTPDGVYLKSFKQDGQRVLMNGYAQSQERVAELLRNLSSNSPWLERPDLIEVRAVDRWRRARPAARWSNSR